MPGPALDAVIAHPVYGSLGWLAVNNPGPATAEAGGCSNKLTTSHGLATCAATLPAEVAPSR